VKQQRDAAINRLKLIADVKKFLENWLEKDPNTGNSEVYTTVWYDYAWISWRIATGRPCCGNLRVKAVRALRSDPKMWARVQPFIADPTAKERSQTAGKTAN